MSAPRFDTTLTPAWEVTTGTLVQWEDGGHHMIALKTHRVGKEYVHHYLVPLLPRPALPALVYVDPDDMLSALMFQFRAEPGPSRDAPATPGDLFTTRQGTFLKVIEDPKSQKAFAFIDIATCHMFRRRERGVTAVHGDWTALAEGADGACPLTQLLGEKPRS
ncbi:MAG: hypothetical protein ACPGO3_02460 [Magnetospiraceae bacterium]